MKFHILKIKCTKNFLCAHVGCSAFLPLDFLMTATSGRGVVLGSVGHPNAHSIRANGCPEGAGDRKSGHLSVPIRVCVLLSKLGKGPWRPSNIPV